MKRDMWIIKIPSILIVILLVSCSTGIQNEQQGNKGSADSTTAVSLKKKKFVNALVSDSDTSLNYTDAKGMKQGKWIVKNNVMRLPGFAPDAKVEEGFYKDGRKEGEWIEYNADGSIRSKVIFKDDTATKE